MSPCPIWLTACSILARAPNRHHNLSTVKVATVGVVVKVWVVMIVVVRRICRPGEWLGGCNEIERLRW